jgi:hypothetical protein
MTDVHDGFLRVVEYRRPGRLTGEPVDEDPVEVEGELDRAVDHVGDAPQAGIDGIVPAPNSAIPIPRCRS